MWADRTVFPGGFGYRNIAAVEGIKVLVKDKNIQVRFGCVSRRSLFVERCCPVGVIAAGASGAAPVNKGPGRGRTPSNGHDQIVKETCPVGGVRVQVFY